MTPRCSGTASRSTCCQSCARPGGGGAAPAPAGGRPARTGGVGCRHRRGRSGQSIERRHDISRWPFFGIRILADPVRAEIAEFGRRIGRPNHPRPRSGLRAGTSPAVAAAQPPGARLGPGDGRLCGRSPAWGLWRRLLPMLYGARLRRLWLLGSARTVALACRRGVRMSGHDRDVYATAIPAGPGEVADAQLGSGRDSRRVTVMTAVPTARAAAV